MALYLDHFVHVQRDGSAPVSLRTRIRLEGGSFGDMPLKRAIELCRADLFRSGIEKAFTLRVLATENEDE